MILRGLTVRVLRASAFLVLLLLPVDLPRAMEMSAAMRAAGSSAVKRAVSAPLRVLEGNVARNQTLATVLSQALSPGGVHRIVEAARPVYDLARLSVGHPFGVTQTPDGLLVAFTYGIDELRTLRVVPDGASLRAEVLTRQYDTEVRTVQGSITSSLFAAIDAAGGEEDQLAIDLAEIFAWDVDFNTELQKGDAFRVAVERLTLDGRFCRYGKILSAELVRGERVLQAVRFDDGERVGYYAPDGTPMRRALLRSPLKFSRISSGFTHARFHPILKKTRPHLGVDYAAATGTPVMASGNGVVTMAGWSGGYGKTVRIRHSRGFETLYGHLSQIRVKAGQRVEQGQVVGNVGSTGLSTAPHLDYRTILNGVYVNPLKVQSPPEEPVPARARAAFREAVERQLALLGTAAAPARLVSATAPVTADH
jgi:murein DD-endopeptidase MepM/ murein hydrolase activator NlpD